MRKLGIPPENLQPNRYTGPRFALTPMTEAKRRPTTLDRDYALGTEWRVDSSPSTGDEGEFWKLVRFEGNGDATWRRIDFTSSATGILAVITDDGAPGIVDDGAGNITLSGGTGITTSGQGPASSGSISLDVPVLVQNGGTGATSLTDGGILLGSGTGAITATAQPTNGQLLIGVTGSDPLLGTLTAGAGITITEGAGSITIATSGGGTSVDSVAVDFNTAPGTDPVLATVAGLMTYQGATVANATNLNSPVAIHSRAANTLNVEVQVGTAVTGAPGDKNDAGLVSFDDTSFAVDADGYVTFAGGTGAPTLQIVGDQGSGNVPSSGAITITGDTVANATHAKPVYVDDTAANSSTIDVQVATAIGAAPGDKNDAGLASFDSTSFAVDSNGFVTFTGDITNGLTTASLYDDFTGTVDWMWRRTGTTNGFEADALKVSGHPGIIRIGQTVPSAGETWRSFLNDILIGGGILTWTCVARFTNTSLGASETLLMGLANSTSSITSGVYFYGSNASSNWRARTEESNTVTDTDTSTAFDTDWHIFEFEVNAAASSVTFRIDGSDVATNTTNIPLTTTGHYFYWATGNLAGSGSHLDLDAFVFTQVRADV